MKTLKLTDGTTIELADSSTENNYIVVVKKWADIDELGITKENVEGATYEGEILENKVFVSTQAAIDGENIVLSISMRDKTDMELMTETIEEQQAMINLLLEV